MPPHNRQPLDQYDFGFARSETAPQTPGTRAPRPRTAIADTAPVQQIGQLKPEVGPKWHVEAKSGDIADTDHGFRSSNSKPSTKPSEPATMSDEALVQAIEGLRASAKLYEDELRKRRRSSAGKIAGLASGKKRQKTDGGALLARLEALEKVPGLESTPLQILQLETGVPASSLYRRLRRARNERAKRS